jgi:hypothetical protein
MKNRNIKQEKNNSRENLEVDVKKETYFSTTEEDYDSDLFDEEQDDFYYNYDIDTIEDDYEGFEFDNFDF